MKIVQIAPYVRFGDAIGNHIVALHREFQNHCINSTIYAIDYDARFNDIVSPYESYIEAEDDIILYHFSTHTPLNREFIKHKCRKGINYHNVTPGYFFEKYYKEMVAGCDRAREDVKFLADKVDFAISDSEYNSSELENMGYTCPLFVVPILIPLDDYRKTPDSGIADQYSDGFKNIVFVGRIAPNKCQQDLITDFYYYKKIYNSRSRLILVGNPSLTGNYAFQLKQYVKKLGLSDVIFTGSVPFSHILAYYKTASLFLCESEHEGFCVPLVEAMTFNVPIIAYDSSAVGETLGDAGILFNEKNPQYAAALMDSVLNNEECIELMKKNQNHQLEKFSPDVVFSKYRTALCEQRG